MSTELSAKQDPILGYRQTFFKAKFTIDPTKKPKTIDYAMTEGFTKGKTQLGIYELDGDTFRSCFAPAGKRRSALICRTESSMLTIMLRAEPVATTKTE